MEKTRGGFSPVSLVRRRQFSAIILFALAFAIAYSQSPLFTSNQNQYFLHGMALAGVGNLQKDWLANTADPTPVFSYLVAFIYKIFRFPTVFYLIYLGILVVYFLSCLGIARKISNLNYPFASFLFFVLFTLIHSTAFRYFLTILLGPDWAYIFEGGLAGQRILGTVFQPSSFGVLLILSVYLFLLRKNYLAVTLSVLAAVFHPTYLLPAATLISAYMWSAYKDEEKVHSAIWLGLFALILVLPILGYVIPTFWPSSPEEYARSQEILVHFRIPHHAVITEWLDGSAMIQFVLVILATFLTRKSKLYPIFVFGLSVSFILTMIQTITGNNALALLFPWRISSILVPLATTVLLARLIEAAFGRWKSWFEAHSALLLISGIVVVLSMMAAGIFYFVQEYMDKVNSSESGLFHYIAIKKRAEDNYLIPIDMQDFRLATGAAVYVDFKSIPYQDQEVLEWHRRVLQASDFYRKNRINCENLREWTVVEQVTHLILMSDRKDPDCSFLEETHRNQNYRLFEFAD